MTPEWVHPGVLLIAGAWLLPLLKGGTKRLVMVLLPAAALVDCLIIEPGTYGVLHFLGQELVFGRADRLSLVFSYVFALVALIGMVYSLHVEDDAQHVAALTYAGGALGVTFAGDFLSLFVFWELMALSAALLVWLRRQPAAVAAGFRYVLVHLFGGLCLLGGTVLHWSQTGSLTFGHMSHYAGSAAFILILVAFLLNAAVPPLGAWLPDAYPEATATGAIFLTAFTTKSAVYALIRGYSGTEILVWWGAGMAVYGVVYAVLENDARRLLAYHIISQVGYMVCGVGIGTTLALNGATAHAFALMLYMVGAFAISAVPLFSGFVSKSMVVSAAGESHRAAVFLLLTLASAGTFLHTGLKLPYYMFFGRDRGLSGKEPPGNMLVAMGLAAAACILIGVFPGLLYERLPNPVDFVPYTLQHVTSTLGMLAFTAWGFFLLLKHLDPVPTISLDTDWFYRRGASALGTLVRGPLARLEYGFVGEIYEFVVRRPVLGAANFFRDLDSYVVDSAIVGVGRSTQSLSQVLRTVVSGNAQHY